MQELEKPALKGIATRRPNPELIAYCEKLLNWAKTGDLTQVVGVAVWQGYSMSSLDCGRDGAYLRTIIGQLEVLKMQILDEIVAHEQGDDHEAG